MKNRPYQLRRNPLDQTPGDVFGAVLNAAANANEAVCDADLTAVLNVRPSKALVENYAESPDPFLYHLLYNSCM